MEILILKNKKKAQTVLKAKHFYKIKLFARHISAETKMKKVTWEFFKIHAALLNNRFHKR